MTMLEMFRYDQSGGLLVGADARGMGMAGDRRSAAAAAGVPTSASQPPVRQAWLREMEKVQVAGWFQPFVAASSLGEASPQERRVSVSEQAKSQQSRAASKVAGWSSQVPTPMLLASSLEVAMVDSTTSQNANMAATAAGRNAKLEGTLGTYVQAMPVPMMESTAATLLTTATDVALRNVASILQDAIGAEVESVVRGAFLAPDMHEKPVNSSPVRLHAEWTPNGLNLWVGLNANDADLKRRVLALMPELQRTLEHQGSRLARLVCNGQVVFNEPSVAESPAPTMADLTPEIYRAEFAVPCSFSTTLNAYSATAFVAGLDSEPLNRSAS